MKNTFALLLLFISFKISAQNFTHEFVYEYKAKTNIESQDKKSTFAVLRVSENESYFIDFWELERKRVREDASKNVQEKLSEIRNMPSSIFSYEIIKNEDTIQLFQKINKKLIGYTEPTIAQELWKILPNDTTILNYKCQKAELTFGGRNWIAYFTPEIATSSGPYKFGGLPGLIIKIHDDKNEHSFELTQIKNIDIEFVKADFSHIQKNKFVPLIVQAKMDNVDENLKSGLVSNYFIDGVAVSTEEYKMGLLTELSKINHIER